MISALTDSFATHCSLLTVNEAVKYLKNDGKWKMMMLNLFLMFSIHISTRIEFNLKQWATH